MKTKIILTIMLIVGIISTIALPAFAVDEFESGTGTGTLPGMTKIDYDGTPTQYELFKTLGNYVENSSDYIIFNNPNSHTIDAFPISSLHILSDGSIEVPFVSSNCYVFNAVSNTWKEGFAIRDHVFNVPPVSNPMCPLGVNMSDVYLNRSVTGDGDVIYSKTTKFNLADLRSGDFKDVLLQITKLLPLLLPAIVGFIAFRKGWSFLKGETRSA